jgi:hypothetical protein
MTQKGVTCNVMVWREKILSFMALDKKKTWETQFFQSKPYNCMKEIEHCQSLDFLKGMWSKGPTSLNKY